MVTFAPLPLIFLVKRFNSPYYLLLMYRRKPVHELEKQVDVLSRAVEISTDGPELQESAPHFLRRADPRGLLLWGKFLRTQRDATEFYQVS